MAQVLAEYETLFAAPEGGTYVAHAVGSEMDDGRWQGWIEFVPLDEAEPLRTPRETTQPNREAAVYWATGLTPVYLEGAFTRARTPDPVTVVRTSVPLFDEPRPDREAVLEAVDVEPVLDPFSVYAKGETVLLNQLAALSPWHLINIIRAYGFSDETAAELNQLQAVELVEIIMESVRDRVETE